MRRFGMPLPGRRSLRLVLAAALAAIVGMVTVLHGSVQAATAPTVSCPPVPVWANTVNTLYQINAADGSVISSAPLRKAFGDIAFSADGSTLYGIVAGTSTQPTTLWRIDRQTGIETAMPAITGPVATLRGVNALSALPNGLLLTGGASNVLYTIDPVTGVSAPFRASLPTGYTSAGDFLSLPDGDILAFASGGPNGIGGIFRIHPDNTVTQIASDNNPTVFGAAYSGGQVYMATPNNGLVRVNGAIPTAPSTAPLPTTTVNSTTGFWGATSAQDNGECNIPPATNSYTVSKTVSPTGQVQPGDVLTYTVTVQNTGNQPYPATSAAFSDDLSAVLDDATFVSGSATATAGTATLSGTTLNWVGPLAVAPAAGSTVTITYKVRVNDPRSGDGVLRNAVKPTGANGTCLTAAACSSTNDVAPPPPNPALVVVKSASPKTVAKVGDVITYSYLVTNTGNVPLANVTVSDTAFSGTGATSVPSCPAGAASLAPGASVTCTASYTVTQADLDAGKISNAATATGNPPSGVPPTSPPSSVQVDVVSVPALTVVKSASPTSVSKVGDVVTYSYVVTNTGNVTLKNATVNETGFSGTGTKPTPTCPAGAASLAPGASVTCTASYAVTQADLDAGKISNAATATGNPPSGVPPTSPPSSVQVDVVSVPALTVVKSASPTSVSKVGDVVTYSYVVTNTGNVTLKNVTVNESAFSGTGSKSAPTCPAAAASLAPGAEVTCTASYTVTQADVDAGQITNTATATGTPNVGTPTVSPPSSAIVDVVPAPGITVVKSASPISATKADDVVTYSYLVTNTGNVTLKNVTINETSFTGSGVKPVPACPVGAASLAPGASVTCTATYTVTQADVDAGKVSNSATAQGTAPTGSPIVSPPSDIGVPIAATPGVTISKSVSPASVTKAGDVVTYSFLVTNTGNVTLKNVAVADTAFSGTGVKPVPACPVGAASLAPGASVTCTATYTVTQADVDAGKVSNSATAQGDPPTGPAQVSPPSDKDVTIAPAPAIAVVKSVSPATVGHVGDVVEYSYLVTNTGNVTLANVAVSDTAFSGTGTKPAPTCPAGAASLAPGEQVTCTALYTITQADADAGKVANSATATGVPPTGTPPQSPPSSATVTIDQNPALTVLKSASPSDAASFNVGDVITYSFLVTNTGNVTLKNVTVTETQFTGTGQPPVISCPAQAASLPSGASVECTATYTVTRADFIAGHVTNTATATGQPPTGPAPVSPPSQVVVPANPTPALTVRKSASPISVSKLGDVITYSFLVTNTGNLPLTNVTVTESAFTGSGAKPVVSCPAAAASLLPLDEVTCTATYTVTQADLDAGQIADTATATGTPPSGTPPVSPPSSAVVDVIPAPGLTVTKSAQPGAATKAGDVITYSFLVTNTGNVTLTNVSVSDTAFSGTGTKPTPTCPAGAASLAPGATVTCTATYTVTQADVDAGAISNAATATGTPPSGTPPVSPSSDNDVRIDAKPAITVLKTAQPVTVSKIGDVVTYSFLVTNTGNVTLSHIAVADNGFSGTGAPLAISCPAAAASLAPSAQVTCTATYTVTQADVDAGQVTNSATVTGNPPSGPPSVSPPSSTTVGVNATPSLTVAKSASPASYSAPGDVITYSFLVTNTGDVTIKNVSVSDTAFSGAGTKPVPTCPAGATSLAPGDQVTCTATYTVTQADIDAGKLSNSATATGTPPSGPPSVSPPSGNDVPAELKPALTVVKSASPDGVAKAGDVITYSFLVTNTGNVTLTNVTAADTGFTGTGTKPAPSCPAGAASLAPGAQVTCTATYTVTQADVDAGSVANSATATGDAPSGRPPVSPPSSTDVPVVSQPGLTVAKSAQPASVAKVGDVITYSFLVTNTGNVTLTNVTVTDTAFSGAGTKPVPTCPAAAASLAPGDQVTCTATYTVTQADLDAGKLSNSATATGTPPSGPPPTSPASGIDVPVDEAPALTVLKTADPTVAGAVGDVITYSFLVTNTGNVTLKNVSVADTGFSGTGSLSIACPAAAASLAPGAQVTCTATYAVTQADIDAGQITNTATASGERPVGPPTKSPPSSTIVDMTPKPGISLVKSADPASVDHAGQTITYSYLVTNAGNVTLKDIAVTESAFSGTGAPPVPACPAAGALLAPGAQVTCTATYTTTQADIDSGEISNSAIATGNPPSGPPPASAPSDKDVPVEAKPAMTITKSADPSDASKFKAGQVITYSYLVANTGNVTLSDVKVVEVTFTGTGPAPVPVCPAAASSMAPGTQVTCTATYTVTQADVDRGRITNIADATGQPPFGPPPTSPQGSTDTPINPEPAIELMKVADEFTVAKVGDVIRYEYVVFNTGNVTLTNVTVTETAFSGTGAAPVPTCPATTLAPGERVDCVATYLVTQADLDAGQITNTAVAQGEPPSGTPPVSPSSSQIVNVTPFPELTLVKSALPPAPTKAGDVVTYSYRVTNTGTVTLKDVTVQETAFTGTGTRPVPTCPAMAGLAPGAEMTCTATYTVTQADVDAGTITNSAFAAGTAPSGSPATSPPSDSTVPIVPEPGLTVVKSASPDHVSKAGDVIAYSFLVTNTGNVTLTKVAVSDFAFTGSGPKPVVECPASASPLEPGAHATCTADYTVTKADMANRKVSNAAVVGGTTPAGKRVTSTASAVVVTAVAPGAPSIHSQPTRLILAVTGYLLTPPLVIGIALVLVGWLLMVLGVRRRRRRDAGQD